MADTPIAFIWEGDGFKPASDYWARRADKQYVIGTRYELVEVLERSRASHAQYFASVQEAWRNLPEGLNEKFPTSEHLRKFALIQCGYHDSHSLVCRSHAEALKVAKFMEPLDEFSVIAVTAATVTRMAAKSQNYRSMDKPTFEDSKRKVLEYLASWIGTTTDQLAKNGDHA